MTASDSYASQSGNLQISECRFFACSSPSTPFLTESVCGCGGTYSQLTSLTIPYFDVTPPAISSCTASAWDDGYGNWVVHTPSAVLTDDCPLNGAGIITINITAEAPVNIGDAVECNGTEGVGAYRAGGPLSAFTTGTIYAETLPPFTVYNNSVVFPEDTTGTFTVLANGSTLVYCDVKSITGMDGTLQYETPGGAWIDATAGTLAIPVQAEEGLMNWCSFQVIPDEHAVFNATIEFIVRTRSGPSDVVVTTLQVTPMGDPLLIRTPPTTSGWFGRDITLTGVLEDPDEGSNPNAAMIITDIPAEGELREYNSGTVITSGDLPYTTAQTGGAVTLTYTPEVLGLGSTQTAYSRTIDFTYDVDTVANPEVVTTQFNMFINRSVYLTPLVGSSEVTLKDGENYTWYVGASDVLPGSTSDVLIMVTSVVGRGILTPVGTGQSYDASVVDSFNFSVGELLFQTEPGNTVFDEPYLTLVYTAQADNRTALGSHMITVYVTRVLVPYPAVSTTSIVDDGSNTSLTIGVMDISTTAVNDSLVLTLVIDSITGGGRFYFANASTWYDSSSTFPISFTTFQTLIYAPMIEATGVGPPLGIVQFHGEEGYRRTVNATWTISVNTPATIDMPDIANTSLASNATLPFPAQVVDSAYFGGYDAMHFFQVEVNYTADSDHGSPCLVFDMETAVGLSDSRFYLGPYSSCMTAIQVNGPFDEVNTALQAVRLYPDTVSGTVTVTMWKNANPHVQETHRVESDTRSPTPAPTMTPTTSPTPAPTGSPTPAPETKILNYSKKGFVSLCVVAGVIVLALCGMCFLMNANEQVAMGRSGSVVFRM